MHEYSIVQSLLDSCEENAKKNNAKKIVKVVIKIGILSGVEPQLLKTAFDTFKLDTVCNDANLEINTQDVVIKCNDCKIELPIINKEFLCPKCKGVNLEVIDGEDMYLMSLEME